MLSNLHRRNQTVHVVASVTIITEQQLVVILTGAAQGTGLALDALPGVLPHADHHVPGELETGRVTCHDGDQLLVTDCVPHLPDLPHSAQPINSSGCRDFLLYWESPRQKSQ